jgi:Branched-chain amino acid ABC-type transport system, permease components
MSVGTGLANALVSGLVTGSIVALGAIGLALVYSIASVPNFAHGELLTLGAYVAFLVNTPETAPVFGRVGSSGSEVALLVRAVLFVASAAAVLSVVYLWGGKDAVRGGWFRDRRVGTALNAVVAVGVGAVVAVGAPSVWSGLVFGALAVSVIAPVLDSVVFRRFREEGAGLATMLMVALGVSFVLRFGTQAVYGGGTRRFEVPESVGAAGYDTSLRAAKHFDAYVGSEGLVVAVTDTATEATVGVVGFGWLAFAGVVVSGVAAAYVGWLAGARSDRLPSSTVGSVAFGVVAAVVAALVLGSSAVRPQEFAGATRVRMSVLRALVVVVALGMMISLHLLLHRTKLGTAMRAGSDNLDLAKVTGIDTDRVMRATWMIAGAFAGTGGVLLGVRVSSVTVSLGFDILVPMFAAVVLGGVGSVYGAMIGSYLVGLSMDAGVYLVPGIGPEYRVPMAFAVLLVVLLVKPEGLRG